jgi:phage-related protein
MKNIGTNAKNMIRNIDWRTLGTTVINFIVNGIRSLITAIPNLLKTIGHNAVTAFKSIDWLSLGANIISGIVNGLWNGVGRIVDAARDVAERALDAAKNFLGINSPSKAFMEVGEDSSEGQAIGMINNADMVEEASKEVAQRALDAQMNVDYTLPDIDRASRDMSASLSSSFMSTVQRIIEVPLNIDAREIARATAWDMGEQLAWEMR